MNQQALALLNALVRCELDLARLVEELAATRAERDDWRRQAEKKKPGEDDIQPGEIRRED